jgi:carbonic anhydrase/acetyltransferase-like protein (isoleucine patch superfamily)
MFRLSQSHFSNNALALSAPGACVTLPVYSALAERFCSDTGSRLLIRSYRGHTPQIAATAYIDPAAVIIGDVTIGEHASVWPGAVIRGDVHWIRIGARTNIQDNSVLHVMGDDHPLTIGDGVTVGHGVILHGCTVESRCLIGMGSIILNGAKIGTGSIVAAGTLVAEGTVVPPGSLFMGHPGKFRRALTAEDLESLDRYAARYVEYKETYKSE